MALAPTSWATLTTSVDSDTIRTLTRWSRDFSSRLLALVEVEERLALLRVAQGGHHHLVERDGTLSITSRCPLCTGRRTRESAQSSEAPF